MRSWSRREFTAATFASALGWPPRLQPDLVLLNGRVHTMDAAGPRAEAIAIAGDRIFAVGTTAEIRALARRTTRRIDLASATVVPGFIDAHSHPALSGRYHLYSVDCDLRSITAIQDAIRERAGRTPPGDWVLGFKYDDTKTKEQRRLSRDDLDQAAPNHPVFISHRGGHTAYVNSAALAKAGVTEGTADPPGGKIEHAADGRLTGRLLESAVDLVQAGIPARESRADYRNGVRLISSMLAKAGITSVHDASAVIGDLRGYQDAQEAGELKTRVYCLMLHTELARLLAAGINRGFGNEWVRVGAIKAVCDGSISERTARLSEPYVGRPNDFGILVTAEPELYEIARKAHEAGWQIGIHANGDVGIDVVLRIYERLQREQPRADPRFRIEHCTVINPDLVARMARLNVIPTPFSTYVYFHGEKMREYGAERLNRMFALRSFLDAGIRPTLASDYPPGPFEPMMALQSMVTRTDMNGTVWGPQQRISVPEALRVTTLNGAFASFEEKVKGSLEVGKLADLVVLGRDPVTTDPGQLIQIPVQRTMVGGHWVYEA